jgi:hypothetical protein
MPIPGILHQIWLGDASQHQSFEIWRERCALVFGGSIVEWGSGLSTLMLADLIATRADCRLLTIDDFADWQYAVMKTMPTRSNVIMACTDLAGPRRDQLDPQLGYATLPLALPEIAPPKLIVIDGRRRLECAASAALLADAGTIVTLHDFRRSRYLPMLGLYDIVADRLQYREMRIKPEVLTAMSPTRQRLQTLYRQKDQRDLALSETRFL